MNKRILITGGAGFIGTHLTRVLSQSDHHVTVLDLNAPVEKLQGVAYVRGDVRNTHDLEPLISDSDSIVHLAALVSVPLCEEDPAGSYETNTNATKKILELIRIQNENRASDKKIRIIFASSSAVYGDLGNTVEKISETMPLPPPVSHYGSQKLDSEKFIQFYVKNHGVPGVIFRFFNVYGKGQKADSPYSGVISQFVKRVRDHETLTLNGGGIQTRDFISVIDLVDALVKAIHSTQAETTSATPINLGSGQAISIADLAQMLFRVANAEAKILSAPARAGDILHSCADISRAKSLLNWQPAVQLSDGLNTLLNAPIEKSAVARRFRFYHLQVGVFFAVALLWAGATFLLQPGIPLSLVTGYASLAAIMMFWLLYGLDYFRSYHPVPSPESLFTLAVISPIAGALAKYIMLAIFTVEMLRYRQILAISPLVAILVYFIQVSGGLAFIRSGIKRKVCLLTSREETTRVTRAFRSKGILKYYEFVDHQALAQEYVRDEVACVVISRSEAKYFKNQESTVQAMIAGCEIIDYRELVARLTGHLDLETLNLWVFLQESVGKRILGRFYYSSKTVLERVLAAILLVVSMPLFIVVALFISIGSRGPIFYGQTRLGYQGKQFRLWKFRSMREDAESNGPQWSKKNDPRVTRTGAFLRKTRIDELPQLLNVIKGEMSLIGPRPERPEFYNELETEIPLFRFRLLVRPGITGWAQVMGGYASTIAETRRKLEYDLFYLQRMTPPMDFLIAAKTVAVGLRGLLPRRLLLILFK
jgi:nucleoside-diphosphate-sugar epimerase/lipopolysaccharide/colanic/teichoic acid biosynthesis glycosyltransferase